MVNSSDRNGLANRSHVRPFLSYQAERLNDQVVWASLLAFLPDCLSGKIVPEVAKQGMDLIEPAGAFGGVKSLEF